MTTPRERTLGELEKLRDSMRVFKEHEEKLMNDLGQLPEGGGDVVDRVKSQEEAAEAFDRLSPAEMMELRAQDRGRWEEVIAAKEQAGLRQLFKRNV